jgi:DnaJ-class molecular chaperone
MKRVHTHYDNLKVARNAPQEVIRAAYKSLSQKYHPDRNPGNPDASRIMSLINTSYEVLSDPVKRKQHDEWIRQQEGTEPDSAKEEAKPGPTQTQAGINFQPPTAGICDFTSLPSSVKEQLVARTTGANKQQFAVRTDNVTWKYVWTAGLVFWFVYLFNDATDFKWGEESTLWLMAFTSGASL